MEMENNNLTMVATDSYRLAIIKEELKTKNNDIKIVVPARVLDSIIKNDFKKHDLEIILEENQIAFYLKEEEKTKGGIIIPDTAKEKPIEGKVVAVGKGKILENGNQQPLEVKKGDKILFGKYAGTEINIEGDEHLIMREDDIIAIVE